jgi:hypothetical protein
MIMAVEYALMAGLLTIKSGSILLDKHHSDETSASAYPRWHK